MQYQKYYNNHYLHIFLLHFIVGNKAKGPISKWVLQENKAQQIFRKMKTFHPLIRTCTCVYQRGKKFLFFGKFGMLCFLETPVLRFILLPCYRPHALNDLNFWKQPFFLPKQNILSPKPPTIKAESFLLSHMGLNNTCY